MRIAFVNHSRRKVGGAEVYIDSVLSAFVDAGHDVAWLYEMDQTADRQVLALPEGVACWSVAELGFDPALNALQHWRPDILFTHGLHDPEFESRLLDVAPGVLYVHNYYGTCISGDKLHSTAIPQVCERQFGPACLLHYFPQHCGGRNPLTMFSRYRQQSKRLELMQRYRALVTNSGHMVRELAQHGLKSECVYPFTAADSVTGVNEASLEDDPIRLVFAGRMTALKGGQYLLGALPEVQRSLARNLHVTFAGDGPERAEWQRRADAIRNESLAFDFPGWLAAPDLQRVLARSHLLVFPSIWPEPFGLSGLEAGIFGVPAAAFAVGGIPEWLTDGVNGRLAGVPPTASRLAVAITKALCQSCHYAQLRAGALREAGRYRLADHIAQLTRIFESCA